MKFSKSLIYLVLTSLFIVGCYSRDATNDKDLFDYKDSYVRDNNAVIHITTKLPSPSGERADGIELKTTEEPYGIIINYTPEQTAENTEKNYEATALYNATFIFALVKNADWIQFNFVEQEYTVTREKLQKLYGRDLREFSNEDELIEFAYQYLQDQEQVEQFFD